MRAGAIDEASVNLAAPGGGIRFRGRQGVGCESGTADFASHLRDLGLDRLVRTAGYRRGDFPTTFQLREEFVAQWAPGFDTTRLCRELALDTAGNFGDLEREIVVAMLLGPIPFEFPSYDELVSAVRIRKNIVAAARTTELAFHTTEAERPAEFWHYAEGCGFTLRPGQPLAAALQKATQPDESGRLYAFSCYRATEYVILLAIAQELALCNLELLGRLQVQWERRSIMSGEFHDVFLREYGSMGEPLPPKWYVPGDRVWFRNPDERSSDVAGYEGSWVFYLGGGLFSNFWKRDKPYTLAAKCLEVFHWRNATRRDCAGELQIDEAIVEELVDRSVNDPADTERILGTMLRFREPRGVYRDGGCIDTSRECPRRVRPATSDIVLPDHIAGFTVAGRSVG